jgi:hypothetical protein
MDFIDEQQGRLAGQTSHAGLLESLLQVGDAGEHRRELLELIARLLGQQARDGGLAGAGRAPEDHRGQALGLGHTADRAVGSQQVVLSHDLVEPLRSQAVGERRRRLGRQAGGFEEIGHVRFLANPACEGDTHRASY